MSARLLFKLFPCEYYYYYYLGTSTTIGISDLFFAAPVCLAACLSNTHNLLPDRAVEVPSVTVYRHTDTRVPAMLEKEAFAFLFFS